MTKICRYTVGSYLVRRLEQAGLKHVFGIPGDYVLELFKYLENSKLKTVCSCNELNAGYAADAYARMSGLSAVCVTYGVGGYSLFNAVVGAFAERIPLIVISGAPRILERSHHHLLHHTTGDMNLQYNMYEKITVSACALVNPEQAPSQIDKTIEACLKFKRPVYIEVPIDIASMPCSEPARFMPDTTITSDKASLDEAVSEAAALLKAADRPVILAGVEAHRLGIRKELQDFIEHAGYPFASSLLGKTVIPEEHPQFIGVYGGYASWECARKTVQKADIILCLGTIMTDIEMGGCRPLLDPSRMIIVNSDKVRIKHHIYNHISLKDFMTALKAKMKKGKMIKASKLSHPSCVLETCYNPRPDHKITVERFYQRMNTFIDRRSIVIGESGDSIFNVIKLFLPKGASCIAQAFYLSIGYATPAVLGAGLSGPDSRVIAFVGDGAFQMSAQEVSTIIKEKLNPIIFVMNNGGYTIERVMVDGPFNDVQMWDYSRLPAVFGGGWGCVVETEGDLETALTKAGERRKEPAIIDVRIDRMDCSDAVRMYGAKYKEANAKH